MLIIFLEYALKTRGKVMLSGQVLMQALQIK